MLARAGTRLLRVRYFASLPEYTLLPLPALSPTMETGNLATWNKAEGDFIEPGDVIAEVETDKAVVDYEAQEEVYLAKILVAEGTKDINVGAMLGVLCEEASDVAALQAADASEFLTEEPAAAEAPAAAASAPAAPAAAAAPIAAAAHGGAGAPADELHVSNLEASPAAAHHMRTHGITPSDVPGTGRNGRVTKGDVVTFLASGGKGSAPTAAQSIAATPLLAGSGAAPAPGAAAAPAGNGLGYTDEKPSQIRAIIAKRLQESKTGIPHFFVEMECELDDVMALRKRLNAQSGMPFSLNDVVLRASALALRDVPAVNSYYDEATGEVLANESVDISVAVATEGGLITPIVTSVDQRGFASIASTVRELAGRARKNKLQPHEFQGGSFTVSNLGMFGIASFNAIINPPQSCILAVGGGSKQLLVKETPEGDAPYTATVMSVQLSCDRRAVDELDAARFLQVFRTYINTPDLMQL